MDSMPGAFSRESILRLIDRQAFTAWFQPIFSAMTGEVHGYEALTRLIEMPPHGCDIGQLFDSAQQAGIISSLDMLCQKNAFRQAAELGFAQQNTFLYVNICPASLMHPDQEAGMTDQLAGTLGIAKERVVIEITEQAAISNYELFKRSVDHYRSRGYKIAIDDFGAGYGGLKMLSIIEPDYVKVDRHFISGIDTDSFKYNLVDALATVCHKLGIAVIAEGIERPEELDVVSRFGIELLQGFLLERPGPALSRRGIALPARQEETLPCSETALAVCTIGAIAKHVEPLTPDQPLLTAHRRFMADQALQGIPIVDRNRLVGMLSRKRFLEQQMIGPYGYGLALSTLHTIQEGLEYDFLAVDAALPIESVVQRIQTRRGIDLGDDLGVTKNGKYLGTVAINDLLAAITQKSLQLAKGANPLSGLPGNAFIERTLTQLISQKVGFAACYIDIDDFKPYNDCYSFEKGDSVIKTLGELIVECVGNKGDDRLPFVGHIGGDDFIAVTRPHLAQAVCRQIIDEFEKLLILFHGPSAYDLGYYKARDRQGAERQLSLMSLSIGIVSTDDCAVDSYGELATLVSGVKRAAKARHGSAIVLNRRGAAKKDETLALGMAA
jgi:EAL domain-containing protein (putative c-di-GMP-specific phosphodiesterase class I)/GGDEF domain-containing protein